MSHPPCRSLGFRLLVDSVFFLVWVNRNFRRAGSTTKRPPNRPRLGDVNSNPSCWTNRRNPPWTNMNNSSLFPKQRSMRFERQGENTESFGDFGNEELAAWSIEPFPLCHINRSPPFVLGVSDQMAAHQRRIGCGFLIACAPRPCLATTAVSNHGLIVTATGASKSTWYSLGIERGNSRHAYRRWCIGHVTSQANCQRRRCPPHCDQSGFHPAPC